MSISYHIIGVGVSALSRKPFRITSCKSCKYETYGLNARRISPQMFQTFLLPLEHMSMGTHRHIHVHVQYSHVNVAGMSKHGTGFCSLHRHAHTHTHAHDCTHVARSFTSARGIENLVSRYNPQFWLWKIRTHHCNVVQLHMC